MKKKNVRFSIILQRQKTGNRWNNVLASSMFAISVVPSSDPIVSSRINYYLLSGVVVVVARWGKQSVKSCHPGNGGWLERENDAKSAIPAPGTKATSLAVTMAADVETVAVFPRRSSTLHGCARRYEETICCLLLALIMYNTALIRWSNCTRTVIRRVKLISN